MTVPGSSRVLPLAEMVLPPEVKSGVVKDAEPGSVPLLMYTRVVSVSRMS